MSRKTAAKEKPKAKIVPGVDVCLIRGCGGKIQSRGLCNTCLVKAHKRIKAEEVTDQQLVELKMILPSRQGKRPKPGVFEAHLAAELSK